MFDDEIEQLESLIDTLQSRLADVRDEEVNRWKATKLVLRLERSRQRLTHTSMTWLGDYEARVGHMHEGYRSTAALVAHRTGERRGTCGSRLWLARRLREAPLIDAAFAAGDITEGHARVLLSALTPRTREAFIEFEAEFVAWARSATADELVRWVDRWIELHDQDGPEPDREGIDDTLFYSQTMDGRLKGKFDFGGELAAVFKATLDARTKKLRKQDEELREVDRTDPLLDQRPSQRAARAMHEVLLDASSAKGLQKPLLSIVTNVRTLAGTASPTERLAELEEAWFFPVPTSLLERWSCDAHASRVVLDAEQNVIDLGRTERLVNRNQRRALAARDHGCAMPGCGTPVSHTDAHHVEHWTEGGRTDLDNLVLLCRWHHMRVHDNTLFVFMVDGVPHFLNRGGDVLEAPCPDPPEVPAA